ncbi:PHO85 cyclin-1 [Escovopsis weberi]|uniref:PHO85 cyclin-1 n=1 Tax=Escovopsis weberi TaxID=150374 RepID=A0A0M9VS21_ESCWE|nr:PHO85 cyclin-1 [Escovopsis weberi]
MASRYSYFSLDDLNRTALEQFVFQPVSRDMISYLAQAAHSVIACDSNLMPPEPAIHKAQQLPPTPPRSPEPRAVRSSDGALPTLDEFITQLVVSSNVQVPTLMTTLVYLNRLKAKLQPMARGLRCTTHRIFLASLIISAKYLNDSSPKNKHWANYTHINNDYCSFGFTRTEVNLMEKQLLFLLEWQLGVSEQDLFRELDFFLEPLRIRIVDRHARKMRQREEKRRQQEMYAAAAVAAATATASLQHPLSHPISHHSSAAAAAAAAARRPSPPLSRGASRTRQATPEHYRSVSNGSGCVTPPELLYSSGSSSRSYASSIASSQHYSSRATTPLDSEPDSFLCDAAAAAACLQEGSLYDSPVQVVLERDGPKVLALSGMHTYHCDVPPQEHYQHINAESGATKKRHRRGVWGRLLGGAVAVR